MFTVDVLVPSGPITTVTIGISFTCCDVADVAIVRRKRFSLRYKIINNKHVETKISKSIPNINI